MLRLLVTQLAPGVRPLASSAASASTRMQCSSGAVARRGMAGTTVAEQLQDTARRTTEAASRVTQKAQAAAKTARTYGMRKALREFRQSLQADAYVLAFPVAVAVSLMVIMVTNVFLHDPEQSRWSFYTLDPDDDAAGDGGEDPYDPTKGPPGSRDKADLSALGRAAEAYGHSPARRFFEKRRTRSSHPYGIFDNDFTGAV